MKIPIKPRQLINNFVSPRQVHVDPVEIEKLLRWAESRAPDVLNDLEFIHIVPPDQLASGGTYTRWREPNRSESGVIEIPDTQRAQETLPQVLFHELGHHVSWQRKQPQVTDVPYLERPQEQYAHRSGYFGNDLYRSDEIGQQAFPEDYLWQLSNIPMKAKRNKFRWAAEVPAGGRRQRQVQALAMALQPELPGIMNP